MDTEILTYSRAKGAFAGIMLEGASLRQDNDSRRAIYGRRVTTRALLVMVRASHESLTLPFCLATRRCRNLGMPSRGFTRFRLDAFLSGQQPLDSFP